MTKSEEIPAFTTTLGEALDDTMKAWLRGEPSNPPKTGQEKRSIMDKEN